MNVVLLKIPKTTTFEEVAPCLSFVSKDRQETILRYKNDQARIRSLAAALLVRHGIHKDLGLSNMEICIAKNKWGKPYLVGYPDYHFSLSHSGSYVAFASDTNPIGVDIEEIKKPHDDIARRFFTEEEASYVAKNGAEGFYEIWTKKEAYVKLLGTGFSTSISSFDVLTNPPASFQTRVLNGYCLTVASKLAKKEKPMPTGTDSSFC